MEILILICKFYWAHLGQVLITAIFLAMVFGGCMAITEEEKLPKLTLIPATLFIFCLINIIISIICLIWKFV